MRYNGLWCHPRERALVTHPYAWWDNWFTDTEINQISAYCEAAGEMVPGGTFAGYEPDIRSSMISAHFWKEENAWIFDKFNEVLTLINNRWYGFDLNGYESFQYGEYSGENKDHFDWHIDMHLGDINMPQSMIEPRKLSMSLMLNQPGVDFEGGEFQILLGREPQNVDLPKGRIIAFPSYIMHRVAPVTKGVRKSLVIWITGPKFI